jgi:hypothetical protein
VRCTIIGVVTLAIGGAVYVFARDAGAVYLLPAHLARSITEIGTVIGLLPTFLHVVAFTMLTIAAVNPKSARACIAIAFGWCAVNMLFEIGQHSSVAPIVASTVPGSFDAVPLLENLAPYFLNGTFDFADLLAAAIGAAASVGLVLWLRNTEKES